MCRILFKKDNHSLFNKEELKYSYETNPDGTGLVYYDPAEDKMVTKKWLAGTNFDEIYKIIQQVENNVNLKNIAIHFRIGTSGGKGIEQIHPQKVKDDMYLFHNGICREFECGNNKSDTQWIAYWLKDLDFNLEKLNNPIEQKIFDHLFSSNKLLLIQKDKYKFVNEDLGRWDNGIWKSWQDGSRYGWDLQQNNNLIVNSSITSENLKQPTIFDYTRHSNLKPKNNIEDESVKVSLKQENKLIENYFVRFDCDVVQELEMLKNNSSEVLDDLNNEHFTDKENIEIRNKLIDCFNVLDNANEKISNTHRDISDLLCMREINTEIELDNKLDNERGK